MSKIIVCDFGLILHRCIFLYKMICIGEINRILGLSKEEDLIAQDVLGMLDFNQEERLQAAYPDHFEQLKAIRRIPVTYNCLNMISGYMNQLKFNPKEDEVVLETIDKSSPAILKPIKSKNYLYLIMPLRIDE